MTAYIACRPLCGICGGMGIGVWAWTLLGAMRGGADE